MLSLLDFTTMVQRFAAAARASAGSTLDFTVGSVWRAVAEASAAIGLWLQWLILIVLRQTRLATSQGSEVDTWVADYGMTRLAASPSAGAATFSRNTVGLAAFISLGTTARTTDGTQSFTVVTDTTNAAWTGTGYALAANAASVTLPVQAVTPGSASNILAGTLTVLTSAIPGVDAVTNAAPFTGGLDAESDDALRARFRLFVDSRSRATNSAVAYAIASFQQGLTYSIVESPGNFVVTVDDGSGSPPSSLLSSVYLAIDAVRPLGTTFSVIAPTVLTATVSMILTAASGYQVTALDGQVATAILAYIDALPIGQPLAYARLAQIALNVPGVVNATAILLNGGTADIGGLPSQVVRATNASVVIS